MADRTGFGTSVSSDVFVVNDVRIGNSVGSAALAVGQCGFNASCAAQIAGRAFVVVDFLVKAGFAVLNADSTFQKDFAAEIGQTAGQTLFGCDFAGFAVGVTNLTFERCVYFVFAVRTCVRTDCCTKNEIVFDAGTIGFTYGT